MPGLPIIDMHLHAKTASHFGTPPLPLCVPLGLYMPTLEQDNGGDLLDTNRPQCPDPIWSPTTDEALIEQTIEVLERHNIIGLLSGSPELVARWTAAAPRRFIPSVEFQLGRDNISVDMVRQLHQSGMCAVFGEITNQYAGIAPDDARTEPYWALAEELDIPIAIHMGEGAPGGPYHGAPRYRARLGSPFLLEDVLVRHPKMRVCVMHYGSPLINEMIAVLYSHPQVYVDIGGIQWAYPRAYFYEQLRQLIDAGFAKRVMFGSDQLLWPGVIDVAISIIDEAPFLSSEQKRDIFYNNAARFLRISNQEIAEHHRQ